MANPGAYVRALRKELGWSQDTLSQKTGDVLTTNEISKIERGLNKLTSVRAQTALAEGFGMSLEDLQRFLDGEVSPAVAVDELCHAAHDRAPNHDALEAAIAFYRDRWSGPVVAAARAITAGRDLSPQDWAALLDRLSAAIDPVVSTVK